MIDVSLRTVTELKSIRNICYAKSRTLPNSRSLIILSTSGFETIRARSIIAFDTELRRMQPDSSTIFGCAH